MNKKIKRQIIHKNLSERENTLLKKSPRSDSFMSEYCQTCEEEILRILLKPFQNIKTKGVTPNPFLNSANILLYQAK